MEQESREKMCVYSISAGQLDELKWLSDKLGSEFCKDRPYTNEGCIEEWKGDILCTLNGIIREIVHNNNEKKEDMNHEGAFDGPFGDDEAD